MKDTQPLVQSGKERSMAGQSKLESLPDEVLYHILQYEDSVRLTRLHLVSRYFDQFLRRSPGLWRSAMFLEHTAQQYQNDDQCLRKLKKLQRLGGGKVTRIGLRISIGDDGYSPASVSTLLEMLPKLHTQTLWLSMHLKPANGYYSNNRFDQTSFAKVISECTHLEHLFLGMEKTLWSKIKDYGTPSIAVAKSVKEGLSGDWAWGAVKTSLYSPSASNSLCKLHLDGQTTLQPREFFLALNAMESTLQELSVKVKFATINKETQDIDELPKSLVLTTLQTLRWSSYGLPALGCSLSFPALQSLTVEDANQTDEFFQSLVSPSIVNLTVALRFDWLNWFLIKVLPCSINIKLLVLNTYGCKTPVLQIKSTAPIVGLLQKYPLKALQQLKVVAPEVMLQPFVDLAQHRLDRKDESIKVPRMTIVRETHIQPDEIKPLYWLTTNVPSFVIRQESNCAKLDDEDTFSRESPGFC